MQQKFRRSYIFLVNLFLHNSKKLFTFCKHFILTIQNVNRNAFDHIANKAPKCARIMYALHSASKQALTKYHLLFTALLYIFTYFVYPNVNLHFRFVLESICARFNRCIHIHTGTYSFKLRISFITKVATIHIYTKYQRVRFTGTSKMNLIINRICTKNVN